MRSGEGLALGAVAAIAAAGLLRQRGSAVVQDSDSIYEIVRGYDNQGNLDIDLSRLSWRYESAYPVRKIARAVAPQWDKNEWRFWLEDEARFREHELGSTGWLERFTRWWLAAPQDEPVILVETGFKPSIDLKDGWHRLAVSVTKGVKTVPAYVGRVPKEIRQQVRRGSMSGSRGVVAPSGYHRTAIASSKPSVPLVHLLRRYPDWVHGRVLDYGTGRGRDCRELHRRGDLDVTCFDVYHPSEQVTQFPKGTFDLVVVHYVLNVLPSAERHQAIRKAGTKVRPGGRIVFAARGLGDVSGRKAAAGWQVYDDGHARFAGGQMQRFQKFYGRAELQDEVQSVLGSSFSPIPLSQPGAGTALVAFSRKR